MVVLQKVGFGNPHGVPKMAEVRAILNLLCEDIDVIDLAGDVDYGSGSIGVNLTEFIFAEFSVLPALVGKGCVQRNRSGVVIVHSDFCIGFRHTKIDGAKFDSKKFEGVFVGGVHLG